MGSAITLSSVRLSSSASATCRSSTWKRSISPSSTGPTQNGSGPMVSRPRAPAHCASTLGSSCGRSTLCRMMVKSRYSHHSMNPHGGDEQWAMTSQAARHVVGAQAKSGRKVTACVRPADATRHHSPGLIPMLPIRCQSWPEGRRLVPIHAHKSRNLDSLEPTASSLPRK
jgi:hypothetical protein